MASPWFDMEAAAWSFLRAQSSYTALGLTEYPSHTGTPIPFDFERGGDWAMATLPAIGTTPLSRLTSERVANGWQDAVLTQWHLVYASSDTSGTGASRQTFEGAVDTVRSLLMGRTAQNTLGKPSAVHIHEITEQTILAVPGSSPGTVVAWDYRFRLRLVRPRFHV